MSIKNWIRNSRGSASRGSASIECALGTVAMLTASFLALDLYRLAGTQATVIYAAATLADYTSRDEEVNATLIDRLADFLHTEQLTASDAAFVVSAVHQNAGTSTLLWTRQVLLGPDAATELADCSRVTQGGAVTLPTEFTMMPGEVVIVGEVCAELTTSVGGTEVLYAHYILPSRADTTPVLLSPDPELEQL